MGTEGERRAQPGPFIERGRGRREREHRGRENDRPKAINGSGHYLIVDGSHFFTNGESKWERERMSHPVLEGKTNANHVRARIRNSRIKTSLHIAQNNSENNTLLHQDVQDIYRVINLT